MSIFSTQTEHKNIAENSTLEHTLAPRPSAVATVQADEIIKQRLHNIIAERNQALSTGESQRIYTYAAQNSPVAEADLHLIEADTDRKLASQPLDLIRIENLAVTDQQATAEVTLQTPATICQQMTRLELPLQVQDWNR